MEISIKTECLGKHLNKEFDFDVLQHRQWLYMKY